MTGGAPGAARMRPHSAEQGGRSTGTARTRRRRHARPSSRCAPVPFHPPERFRFRYSHRTARVLALDQDEGLRAEQFRV